MLLGFISSLLGPILGLLLLLTDDFADIFKGVARDDQAGRNESFSDCNESITAAFLVFAAVDVVDVALSPANDGQWRIDDINDRALDLIRLLIHDWELLIHLAQLLRSQLVCLCDIGRNVAVWLLGVRQHRLDQLDVYEFGDLKGFIAHRILLESLNRVRDNGVGSNVLVDRVSLADLRLTSHRAP